MSPGALFIPYTSSGGDHLDYADYVIRHQYCAGTRPYIAVLPSDPCYVTTSASDALEWRLLLRCGSVIAKVSNLEKDDSQPRTTVYSRSSYNPFQSRIVFSNQNQSNSYHQPTTSKRWVQVSRTAIQLPCLLEFLPSRRTSRLLASPSQITL